MIIKIPQKFLEAKTYQLYKERSVYINTDHIQAIQVETYDYGQGDEYHIQLISMQGYITVGITNGATKEMRDEFLEWIDEAVRKDKL